MKTPRHLSIALLALAQLAGCGSSTSSDNSASPESSAKPKGSSSASASSATSASSAAVAAGPLDPKMVALTKDILACTYKDDSFSDCKALDDFGSSHDPYFDTDAANQALIDMLTGSDDKLALIATKHYPNDPSKVLADKGRVEKLFSALERPKGTFEVRASLVRWLAKADLEKLGLLDRLKALTKSSDVAVRKAVAYGILAANGRSPAPAVVDVVGGMLADADPEVVKSAAMGLSNESSDGSPECALLTKAVERADEKTDHIVWSAGSSNRCKGLSTKVVDYVDKRTSDPTKITNSVGIDFAQAVEFACRDEALGDAGKKKAYGAGLHMVDAKDPDPNTRYAAMSTLVECDKKDHSAAKSEIEKLAKDKDKFVSDVAKKKLEDLKKAAKK